MLGEPYGLPLCARPLAVPPHCLPASSADSFLLLQDWGRLRLSTCWSLVVLFSQALLLYSLKLMYIMYRLAPPLILCAHCSISMALTFPSDNLQTSCTCTQSDPKSLRSCFTLVLEISRTGGIHYSQ